MEEAAKAKVTLSKGQDESKVIAEITALVESGWGFLMKSRLVFGKHIISKHTPRSW